MNSTADQLATHWQMTCAVTVRHAVTVLRQAGTAVTGKTLLAVIRSAPQTREQAADPAFKERSGCWRALDEASVALSDRADAQADWAAYHEAEAHFTQVLPALGPAACALLVQSVAGVVLGLRGMEFELPPRAAWPTPAGPPPEAHP
ncbi:MAG: hypothetical protein ABGY75_20200 [Gemmataceae bacterium]